jgi:nucleotide-binding universal stress UspA family protein
MHQFLVAVDGSENSIRAADFLLKQISWFKDPVNVHLINVQPALPGDVSMFVEKSEVRRFQEQRGLVALANVRTNLDVAGVRYMFHVAVGNLADEIVNYAIAKNCEQIYLGTRGMGAVAGLLFGSVANKVVHLSPVPVLLVK